MFMFSLYKFQMDSQHCYPKPVSIDSFRWGGEHTAYTCAIHNTLLAPVAGIALIGNFLSLSNEHKDR